MVKKLITGLIRRLTHERLKPSQRISQRPWIIVNFIPNRICNIPNYRWGVDVKNMSDGEKDGFVLMYCKDGVIYPVALRDSDLQMLDLTIGMSLGGKITLIKDKPQGTVTKLLGKEVAK